MGSACVCLFRRLIQTPFLSPPFRRLTLLPFLVIPPFLSLFPWLHSLSASVTEQEKIIRALRESNDKSNYTYRALMLIVLGLVLFL